MNEVIYGCPAMEQVKVQANPRTPRRSNSGSKLTSPKQIVWTKKYYVVEGKSFLAGSTYEPLAWFTTEPEAKRERDKLMNLDPKDLRYGLRTRYRYRKLTSKDYQILEWQEQSTRKSNAGTPRRSNDVYFPKVGDRVKIGGSGLMRYEKWAKGKEGTVIRVSSGFPPQYDVEMDGGKVIYTWDVEKPKSTRKSNAGTPRRSNSGSPIKLTENQKYILDRSNWYVKEPDYMKGIILEDKDDDYNRVFIDKAAFEESYTVFGWVDEESFNNLSDALEYAIQEIGDKSPQSTSKSNAGALTKTEQLSKLLDGYALERGEQIKIKKGTPYSTLLGIAKKYDIKVIEPGEQVNMWQRANRVIINDGVISWTLDNNNTVTEDINVALEEINGDTRKSNAGGHAKTLSIIQSPDGKYRLVGAIHEQALEDKRKKGFKTYQDALDAIKRYGYKEWREVYPIGSKGNPKKYQVMRDDKVLGEFNTYNEAWEWISQKGFPASSVSHAMKYEGFKIVKKKSSGGRAGNPGRPTQEFWQKVYPDVEAYYKTRYPASYKQRAAAVTASIWHYGISPSKKAIYEYLRKKREGKLKNPTESVPPRRGKLVGYVKAGDAQHPREVTVTVHEGEFEKTPGYTAHHGETYKQFYVKKDKFKDIAEGKREVTSLTNPSK